MPRHLTSALAISAVLGLALSGCSAGLTSTTPAASGAPYTPSNLATGSAPVYPGGTSSPQAPAANGHTASTAPVNGVTAPTATLGGTTGNTSATRTTPTPSATEAPLAGADFSRPGVIGGEPAVHMRFDVVSLTREGPLLQLAARISSLDPVTAKSDKLSNYGQWYVTGLSDTTRGNGGSEVNYAFSGTSLIDATAKKRYLVAVDSTGACLCTAALNSTYMIGPGQSLTLDATYAAPPTTTRTMDVDVPGIGDFADVPIS